MQYSVQYGLVDTEDRWSHDFESDTPETVKSQAASIVRDHYTNTPLNFKGSKITYRVDRLDGENSQFGVVPESQLTI